MKKKQGSTTEWEATVVSLLSTGKFVSLWLTWYMPYLLEKLQLELTIS